jgi:hypothetical protein
MNIFPVYTRNVPVKAGTDYPHIHKTIFLFGVQCCLMIPGTSALEPAISNPIFLVREVSTLYMNEKLTYSMHTVTTLFFLFFTSLNI